MELIVDDAKSNETLVQMNGNYGSFGDERILFLNDAPFEVLLRNNAETSLDKLPYLVRDFEISYTPSASVLANLGNAENDLTGKPSKSFLAFAAPDYGVKSANQDQLAGQNIRAVFGENRSWDLTDLPNAAVEARRISKLFPAGQATVFSGAQATEEQAKTSELLSQYRYLLRRSRSD